MAGIRIFSPQDVPQALDKDWQLPLLHPLHEHSCRRSPWLMQIQSKPFQVISGNRTQVGACCIYFVLLLKPNCPSLPSYVAGVMGTSSCSPAQTKWKTSQRKQERSWARTSCWVVLQEAAPRQLKEELPSLVFAQGERLGARCFSSLAALQKKKSNLWSPPTSRTGWAKNLVVRNQNTSKPV